MNLPNKLTMMRVVLVPVFMIFAAVSHYGTADFHAAYMLIAGVIFAIASITDFLDGYLARKNHLVTDFGKFMDPLADKCLTTAAFIYMVTDHVCSPIVLAVILFREFAVAGVRMLAAETGSTSTDTAMLTASRNARIRFFIGRTSCSLFITPPRSIVAQCFNGVQPCGALGGQIAKQHTDAH